MTSTAPAQRAFTLTWTLDASPAEVFRAWTDPEHLGWFYNPNNPVPEEPIELDLRVGGAWRQRMDGRRLPRDRPRREARLRLGRDRRLARARPRAARREPHGHRPPQREGRAHGDARHGELPESLSETEAREWLEMGITNGWRDTVDRLAAVMPKTVASG
jgi:hypothetical protein